MSINTNNIDYNNHAFAKKNVCENKVIFTEIHFFFDVLDKFDRAFFQRAVRIVHFFH